MNEQDLAIFRENFKTFLQAFVGKEAENFLNSFMYFYEKLGDDRKLFFERLYDEAQSLKNNTNANENDFIKLFEEELKNLTENTKDIEPIKDVEKQPIENIQNENVSINQVIPKKEQNLPQMKKFTLPMNWENFQYSMDCMTKDFLKNNQIDLKKMNLYTEKDFFGTTIGIYAKNNLLPEEKIKEFQVQYAKEYLDKLSEKMGIKLEFLEINSKNDIILQAQCNLTQLDFMQKARDIDKLTIKNPNYYLNIDEIKTFHQESKNFIDVFEDEIKQDLKYQKEPLEINNNPLEEQKQYQENQNPSIQASLKPSEDLQKPQYSTLLDFFEKKRIENQNLSISKDEFKKDFLDYCKTNMNEQEMQTLVNLYKKSPTKLTKEHKDMIEKGMRYNLINNNLLDKDLEISIKVALNIPIDKQTNEIKKPLENKKQIQQEDKNKPFVRKKK